VPARFTSQLAGTGVDIIRRLLDIGPGGARDALHALARNVVGIAVVIIRFTTATTHAHKQTSLSG